MIGDIVGLAKGLVDRFFPPDATPEQKAEMEKAIASEISKRDESKAAVMVAEMNQSDQYTKRARPKVVYWGLYFIAINHVAFPLVGRISGLVQAFFVEGISAEQATAIADLIKPIPLPSEFWWAWTGIVSTWVLGRSAEKVRGVKQDNIGKILSLVTGNKPSEHETP